MTSTLTQGADRLGEQVSPLRALALSPALIVLLLGALALRLTIAYVLFPSAGFETDIDSYASWALTLAAHGPGGFYQNTGFSDYPPAYLYLLWPLGLIARATGPEAAAMASGLIKVPPILIDMVVGYVIYRLVRGWAWPAPRAESLAIVAAALYVFNPVTIYDSALWGQTDAAGALVLLLGVAALIRGNSEGATALAVTAALVKPQFGVVLIPLVGVMLLKRHVLRPGSGPRYRPWAPSALAGWLDRERGPVRLVTGLGSGLAAFFILALPFGLGIVEYLELMAETAGGYSYLSVNAFNGWALLGSGGSPPLAEALTWSEDTVPFLGPIPAVAVGVVMLAVGFLWALWRAVSRDDRWTLLVALAVLAMAFFVLPTRVHERYIFPAFAVLPILAVGQRRWTLALLALSVGALINLHAILTLPLYGTENVEDLPLGPFFRTQPLIVVSALLQTAVGLWAAWQLRPSLATSPDPFEREAFAAARAAAPSARAAAPAEPAAPAPPAPPLTAPVPGAHAAVTAASPPADPPTQWVRGPGALDWLGARISRPPIRRARGGELLGEPGGRLDRRDLLFVIVLIVGTATLRGFRVDEPYSMYFDEVYHARTATEFLQHWEYGQAHAIYEYTHPHLAKYAMALGIQAAGGNRVTGTGRLGVPVRGAAIEARWAPDEALGTRNGDRLYVGTGTELRAYDLATRQPVGNIPLAAGALAIDAANHHLYAATTDGAILRLDTTLLDAPENGGMIPAEAMEVFTAGPGGPVRQLVVTQISVVAVEPDGRLTAYDIETGVPLGQRLVAGATDVVAMPWTDRVVADTERITDPGAAAEILADDLTEDTGRIEALLASGSRFVVVDAYVGAASRTLIQDGIDDGTLSGLSLAGAPMLAVGGPTGIGILDAQTLDVVDELGTEAPVTGLALVARGLSEATLFASAGTSLQVVPVRDDGPSLSSSLEMPGAVRQPAWNEPAGLLHVLGTSPQGEPTVYVVELNGRAVFADAPLPFDPAFMLVDTQPERPSVDRGQILALAAEGDVASVDIHSNAFGWRLPGVLLGALAAGLLYLLARILFRRRGVGVIAAVLLVAEGMLFANSRIGMNDVYVTTFILMGALLFAAVYVGTVRSWWARSLLLSGTGLALGLALASKWVALYAMGGLVMLVLVRSGLGRVMALLGMATLTAVLGSLAIQPGSVDDPNRNWAFLVLMLALTGLLAASMVRRPLAFTRTEVWLAVVGPLLLGAVLLAAPLVLAGDGPSLEGLITPFRLRVAGGVLLVLGLATLVVAWLATRAGLGPFATRARTPPEPSSGWLVPDRLAGLPWLLGLAALTVLPLGVYVVSYAPWVELGNLWVAGFPEGNTGQTLAALTGSMYAYHDDLRAAHAAASPWWAWPLDLKPVWFYQERFAGPTTALIYDTGNLVVFWLGLPAMAFTAWAAWRRRSMALAVVLILWAALWLPWARIDRATFQYHVYASLPFAILGLAYFLAELWHGPGPRVWLLARTSAALAILGVPLSWLLRQPLCLLAGTAAAHPDGVGCGAIARTGQLSEAALVSLLVIAGGAGVALWLAWQGSGRAASPYPGPGASRAAVWLPALIAVAFATVAGVVAVNLALPASAALSLTVTPEVLAVIGLAILAIPAWLVLRARDARRFVLGALLAAILWLVAWYPNLAGLPLPADYAHVYQGVLPTWNWDFQFAVNLDPPTGASLVDVSTLVVGAVTVLFLVAVAFVARGWGGRARGGPATHAPPSGLGRGTIPEVPRSG